MIISPFFCYKRAIPFKTREFLSVGMDFYLENPCLLQGVCDKIDMINIFD